GSATGAGVGAGVAAGAGESLPAPPPSSGANRKNSLRIMGPLCKKKNSEKTNAQKRRSAGECTYLSMGANSTGAFNDLPELLQLAATGHQQALQDLFARYRNRLKRMVRLQLSRRLQGRVDDSDVLQESFLEISKKLPEYVQQPTLPFFLWLRHMTGLK